MDSDVSAEDDFDNESTKNGAWMSSNSDGHQSSSDQGSPVKNSDRASSSPEGQHSSNVKQTSNSNHESSSEAKESDVSDKEDDEEDIGGDDDEDDDDEAEDDDGDDDEDEDDGEDDEDEDDNDDQQRQKRKGSTSDSSRNRRVTDIDNIVRRKLSHELNAQQSEIDSNGDSDSDLVKNTDGSPPSRENVLGTGGVYENPSSPKIAVSPANSQLQDRDDENDDANEDNNNSDDRSRRNSGNDVDGANTPYESVNGDLSPKSAKCSNSAGWDSRSELASSLDSVSPSQFERQQSSSKIHFEPRDNSALEQTEKNVEIKKTIIDFADDLSDVSDIESNDSYAEREVNVDQPDRADAESQQEIENRHQHQQKKSPPTESPPQQQQQPQQHHRHHHHQNNQRRQHAADSINEKHVDDEAVTLHVEGEEQLDFEAEEGECSPKLEKIKDAEEEAKKYEEKEKDHSDLEEGELTDDNDAKPEETERPVCRFFSRGHCTWGSNCRFIHPGVMDKGNYSMFETVRPIITAGGAPPPNSNTSIVYPVFPPHLAHSHLSAERPGAMVTGSGGGGNVSIARKDEPALESSWERGLRQAKEMIRKSSKRKETEVDFEDKKMNLTLSQDEIDKENDYYSRNSASPGKSPDVGDKWKLDVDVKSHRIPSSESYGNDGSSAMPHAGADVPPLGYYPPLHHGISRPAAADYWSAHRMGGLPYDEYGLRAPPLPYGADYYAAAAAAAAGRRYMHPNSYYAARPANVSAPQSHHPEFYDRKQKHKAYPSSSREVIVQKNDKAYKDDSPSRYRNRREDSPRMERARDDEWADPWMRTKSPASGRARRRKDAYSSASSYSSSSESSRSSSRSSFSSKSRHSRSRSKARSSGSHSQSHSSSRSASESQTRKKALMQFKLSPSSRTQLPAPKKAAIKSISPTLLLERRAATERAMHMNPPPPSPKVKTRPHSPPAANVGGGGNVVAGSSLPSSASSPRPKSGLPDRLLAHSKAAVAAAMRSARSSESRSSKSSSGSSSSDSSSDSSDSSASSSSTSKSGKTPPVRPPKRNVPANDHSATSQTVKNKAMDALKLSGQKQQIKLTLKGSGNATQSKRVAPAAADNPDTRKEKLQSGAKKRAAQSTDSDSDRASSAKKNSKPNPKRGVPSRREELLKQLKAVEDAIARKKSKIS